VDASNRIIAAVLKTTLERAVGRKTSGKQRSFVTGRQMLMNLIDVVLAAQKISIKSERGDHTVGLPCGFPLHGPWVHVGSVKRDGHPHAVHRSNPDTILKQQTRNETTW